MQFCVSQMNVNPLLVRVRPLDRAFLCHAFAAADTRDLLLEVRGRNVQRYRHRRLQWPRLGRILEPGVKGQRDQPAPSDKAEQPDDPFWPPPISERESIERQLDEPTDVPDHL